MSFTSAFRRVSTVTLSATLLLPLAAAIGGCSGASTSGSSSSPLLAVPTVTWTTPASVPAGTALGTTQLNANANVPGTYVYTPPAGTVLSAGTTKLSMTFTPTDSTHFAAVTLTNSIVVTAAQTSPAYTWNNVPIVGGGFVDGVLFHPTQKGLRYARTDVGGAYRWNATTSSWTPLTDFLTRSTSNSIGIESIGLDPKDPQRLYLATGLYADSYGSNGAFLLSSDQGATFTTVPAPFKMGGNDEGRYAGERLAVDPNLGTTLYYGTHSNGLWQSLDRGVTWAQVTTFPVSATTSGAGVVFVDFIAASGTSGTATPVIYVGVSDTGISTTTYAAVYRSTDAGKTWAAVPGQPTGFYPSHGVLGPDGALYLSYANGIGPNGVTSGALYQYTLPAAGTPGGAGTWVNITPGATPRPSNSQGGFGAIAVDAQRPGVLMASTMDDYYPYGDDIYRSLDFGKTWVSLDQQGKVMDPTLSPWVTFGAAKAGTGNWPGTLVIDPFDSTHVEYGNGQTIWESTNITVSDSGTAPTFAVGAKGLEETVVLSLISPTAGANLVSGVGDIGGFVHTTFAASQPGGASQPLFSSTTGLDFAAAVPATLVRVGAGTAPKLGAYSTDSGATWTIFATLPAGTTTGQGQIAASADGTTFVWAPADAPVAYSKDAGKTWTASSGATAKSGIVSDRINSKKFYILSGTTLQISADGGATFTTASTALPSNSVLSASFAAEGDLWLATPAGLMHSTNSGSSFSTVAGLTAAYAVGFGKAATGASYPAIYAIGSTASAYGFFRSTDGGATFVQINDAAHQYGYTSLILGDPRLFGRVYVGTGGRGIIYGDSPY